MMLYGHNIVETGAESEKRAPAKFPFHQTCRLSVVNTDNDHEAQAGRQRCSFDGAHGGELYRRQ